MEENRTPFEARIRYTKKMVSDLQRESQLFSGRYAFSQIFRLIILVWFVTWFFHWPLSGYDASYLVIFILIMLIPDVFFWFNSRKGGIAYKRNLMPDGTEGVNLLHFEEDALYIVNPASGNRHTLPYGKITGLGHSKQLFCILLEYKQFLAFPKENLSGGSVDALFQYLLPRCPKLKQKRLRTSLPGRLLRYLYWAIIAIALLSTVIASPAVRGLFAPDTFISDAMEPREIVQRLEAFDIRVDEDILDEMEIEFLDYYGPDPSPGARASYFSTLNILGYAGCGSYDPVTWEWTPPNSGVYWFDMEAFNLESMYTDLLRGVSSLDPEELAFTDIQEDHSLVDWENGTGTQTVRFRWNGQDHQLNANVDYDWYDLGALDLLNEIIRSADTGKQLWFASDGGQGLLVFYADAQWSGSFFAATGIKLHSSPRSADIFMDF